VCLLDAETEEVLGAGILVGSRHVLSCAHVVAVGPHPGPDGREAAAGRRLAAKLMGLPGQPSSSARVLAEHWIPEAEDGSGDLVLLELSRPQPEEFEAPLYRLPPTFGRTVRAFGFPRGLDDGVWVRAALGGPAGPRGEWAQLDPLEDRDAVDRGFSGAGVRDDENGSIIGMVVTRALHPQYRMSFMLPVESILRYLPGLARRVRGRPAVDPSLSRPEVAEPGVGTDGFAEQLADWLAGKDTRPVWSVVVGSVADAHSSQLRRALALSDREWPGRDAAASRSPAGTVPPVGSVDLAVDATGLTLEEVRARVVDRLRGPVGDRTPPGDWLRSSAPPVRLVVEGVDDAARPEALVSDLLGPLVDRGGRVLLALRRPATPALAAATSSIAAPSTGSLRERLSRLAAEVGSLDRAERAAEELRAMLRLRVTPVPAVPERAVRFRLIVTTLARELDGAAGGDRAALAADVGSLERAVERARRILDAVHRELRGLAGEAGTVIEMRGLLEVYAARAADGGIAEDEALGSAYRSAHRLVWQAPCDLPAAREAVQAYVATAYAELEKRRRVDDDAL
jgi:hypothetical protein